MTRWTPVVVATSLRSSPTLEGRCCETWPAMVIGTSLLRSSPTLEGRCCSAFITQGKAGAQCCDPHRPWRAGAARAGRAGHPGDGRGVAILTDPGGPVLLGPLPDLVDQVHEVAILT